MKKISVSLFFSMCLFFVHAQHLLHKIPADASFVMRYAGEKMIQKMPMGKLDDYRYAKLELLKLFGIDSTLTLESTGINFATEAYQYYCKKDSTANLFVTMVALNDSAKFNAFILSRHAEKPADTINGYQLLRMRNDTYLGWNGKFAMLVNATEIYRSYRYDDVRVTNAMRDSAVTTSVDSFKMAIDSFAIVRDEEVVTPAFDSPKVSKKKKSVKGTKKTSTAKNKKKKKKPVVEEEEMIFEKETIDAPPTEYDSKRYEEERIKKELALKTTVVDYYAKVFHADSLPQTILSNPSYLAYIDANSDMYAWFDWQQFQQNSYNEMMNYGLGSYFFRNMHIRMDELTKNYGYKMAMNLYFENDRVRTNFKAIPTSAEMAGIMNETYSTHQSPAMLKHLTPNPLAYFSNSCKTEALFKSYYSTAKSMVNMFAGGSDSAGNDVGSLVADIMEIMIDEKAIADVLPGNFMMVLHDLKPKKVSYTTYAYDSNFNYTEVRVMKTELSPAVTAVFETKNEKIINKIFKVIKRAQKMDSAKIYLQQVDDHFELALGDSSLVSRVYYQAKNGQFIITTEKEQLGDVDFKTDMETERAILNNNFAARFDMKKIVDRVGGMDLKEDQQNFQRYFIENFKNVQMEGKMRNGVSETNIIFNIDGKHNNGLQYIFDVIEFYLETREKEKANANLTMLN